MTPVTLRCPLVVVAVFSGEHGHLIWPTHSRREGSAFWRCGMRWDWEWMGAMKPVANFCYGVSQFKAFAAVVEFCFYHHCFAHDFIDSLSGLMHEFVEGVFDIR